MRRQASDGRRTAARCAGVKIRIRTSASSEDGGSTNTVSDRFVSRASVCIVTGVEIARIREDGELVAGERDVGEDVGDHVAKAAHRQKLPAPCAATAW